MMDMASKNFLQKKLKLNKFLHSEVNLLIQHIFVDILSIWMLQYNMLLDSLHYVKSSFNKVFRISFSVPCEPFSMIGSPGIENGAHGTENILKTQARGEFA